MIFSVVIPTKNRAQEIARILDILKKQNFEDFEVIIVDESSNNLTENVCKKYSTELNIKYFRVKLGGVARARNFALT